MRISLVTTAFLLSLPLTCLTAQESADDVLAKRAISKRLEQAGWERAETAHFVARLVRRGMDEQAIETKLAEYRQEIEHLKAIANRKLPSLTDSELENIVATGGWNLANKTTGTGGIFSYDAFETIFIETVDLVTGGKFSLEERSALSAIESLNDKWRDTRGRQVSGDFITDTCRTASKDLCDLIEREAGFDIDAPTEVIISEDAEIRAISDSRLSDQEMMEWLNTRLNENHLEATLDIDGLQDAVKGVAEDSSYFGQLSEELRSSVDRVAGIAGANAALLEQIQKSIQQKNEEEVAKALQQQRTQLLNEAAHSFAAAANFFRLIGVSEDVQEAADAVARVSSASFDIRQAIRRIEQLSNSDGVLSSLATAGAMFNIGTAALSIFSVMQDTGPSADEVIRQELARLQQQIESLRTEMHERFDLLDQRLDAVLVTLRNGFNQLAVGQSISIGLIRESIAIGLSTQYFVLREADSIRQLVTELEAERCIGRVVPFTDAEFNDCISILSVLANTALVLEQVPFSPGEHGSEDAFPAFAAAMSELELQDRHLGFLRGAINHFIGTSEVPMEIVNPGAWVGATLTYLDILVRNLAQTRLVLNGDYRLEEMQLLGEFLLQFKQEILSGLTTREVEEGSSIFEHGPFLAAYLATATRVDAQHFRSMLTRKSREYVWSISGGEDVPYMFRSGRYVPYWVAFDEIPGKNPFYNPDQTEMLVNFGARYDWAVKSKPFSAPAWDHTSGFSHVTLNVSDLNLERIYQRLPDAVFRAVGVGLIGLEAQVQYVSTRFPISGRLVSNGGNYRLKIWAVDQYGFTPNLNQRLLATIDFIHPHALSEVATTWVDESGNWLILDDLYGNQLFYDEELQNSIRGAIPEVIPLSDPTIVADLKNSWSIHQAAWAADIHQTELNVTSLVDGATFSRSSRDAQRANLLLSTALRFAVGAYMHLSDPLYAIGVGAARIPTISDLVNRFGTSASAFGDMYGYLVVEHDALTSFVTSEEFNGYLELAGTRDFDPLQTHLYRLKNSQALLDTNHTPLECFEEPNGTPDSDGDGARDECDFDDDDDSVVDARDAFPLDPNEQLDTDGDLIGNNADLDDDGDGVLDEFDAFPLDPARHSEEPVSIPFVSLGAQAVLFVSIIVTSFVATRRAA